MAKIFPVPSDPPPSFFVPIADLVRRGGLLAVGTESSYALAASVSMPHALDRVVDAKKRPSGKPLLVLIGERSQLETLAGSIPSWVHAMVNEFWPGPLTVIVPAQPGLSSVLTAGTGTIGIREPAAGVPADPIATHGSVDRDQRQSIRASPLLDRRGGGRSIGS